MFIMHFFTIKYAFVNKLIMQFLTSNKVLVHKFIMHFMLAFYEELCLTVGLRTYEIHMAL